MSNVSRPQDADAEREIDLGRWRRAVAARWWIVAAGLAAGFVFGAVYSLSGGNVWEASVLLTPGQAFTQSGSPVLVYQASPLAINDIVTQETSLVAAAAKAHMAVGDLRNRVTTQSLSTGIGTVAARGSILIKITVQASKATHAADAANALGDIVIADTTSPYVKKLIATLEQKIASYQAQLTSVTRLVGQYNATLATTTLAPFDKLILVNEANNALLFQGNLNDKIAADETQLVLSQDIEIAQIVSPASAVKVTARSRRNSILVGGLIGLILGAIAAIIAETRMPRSRPV